MLLEHSITTYSDVEKENNKVICYGFGCQDYAYEIIEVNIGIYGTMQLSLCHKCKLYFSELNNNGNHTLSVDKAQQSIRKRDQKA